MDDATVHDNKRDNVTYHHHYVLRFSRRGSSREKVVHDDFLSRGKESYTSMPICCHHLKESPVNFWTLEKDKWSTQMLQHQFNFSRHQIMNTPRCLGLSGEESSNCPTVTGDLMQVRKQVYLVPSIYNEARRGALVPCLVGITQIQRLLRWAKLWYWKTEMTMCARRSCSTKYPFTNRILGRRDKRLLDWRRHGPTRNFWKGDGEA